MEQFSRIINKVSTIEGTEPTIPLTSDFDETWTKDDIYVGELYFNRNNERLFPRGDQGRVEIPTSGIGLRATTTDASVNTTLISVPDDSALMLEVEIMAIQDDGSKAANIFLRALYKNNGGILTIVGSVSNITTSDFTTLAGNLAVSGTDAVIAYVGEAATDINWSIKYKKSFVNA